MSPLWYQFDLEVCRVPGPSAYWVLYLYVLGWVGGVYSVGVQGRWRGSGTDYQLGGWGVLGTRHTFIYIYIYIYM
jgi:hypothetical protein